MTPHKPPLLIDVKEAAHILGITPRQVRENEKKIGLDKCRVTINVRVIRYHLAGVMAKVKIEGTL